MALTPKQRAFVSEYICDLNGAAAARRAGYSEKGARNQASDLLAKPCIQDAIAKAMAARSKRTEVTADRVIEELARIGFANILDYVTVQGSGDAYIDLSEMTREQAAAIGEIVTEEYTDGRGEDARNMKRVRFKLHDKLGALEKLGKHLVLYTDVHRHGLEGKGRVEFRMFLKGDGSA